MSISYCIALSYPQIPSELITLDPDKIRRVNPKPSEDGEEEGAKVCVCVCVWGGGGGGVCVCLCVCVCVCGFSSSVIVLILYINLYSPLHYLTFQEAGKERNKARGRSTLTKKLMKKHGQRDRTAKVS